MNSQNLFLGAFLVLVLSTSVYATLKIKKDDKFNQCVNTARKIQLQREKEHLELFNAKQLDQIIINCVKAD